MEKIMNATTEAQAIETATATTTEAPAPEFPKQMVLFTASRGKAKFLKATYIEVHEGDPHTKIKGCAIEVPQQVADAVGTDKFVSYIELEKILACIEEGKAVRGMASTVADVAARYAKTTGATGDKVALALKAFEEAYQALTEGAAEYTWEAEEEEVETPAPEAATEEPVEEDAPEEVEAEDEVDDPFEIEEE